MGGGFSRGLDICRFVFSVDVLVCKGCLYIGGFVGIFTQAVWSFVYVCNFSWVDTGIGIWLAMFTGGCCVFYILGLPRFIRKPSYFLIIYAL